MTSCAPSQVTSIVHAIEIMIKEGSLDATQVSDVTARIVLVAEQLKTRPADLPAVIEAVLGALAAQGTLPSTDAVPASQKKCCGMA